MTFRVGQKVARVGGTSRFTSVPPLHKPCTISNVYLAYDGEEMIELFEYPDPKNEVTEAGYRSQFFRLVVEKKTDISIFTDLLLPTKEFVNG